MTPASRLRSEVGGSAARLRTLLADPDAAQAARLKEILQRNASCEAGRRHGFAGIDSAARYRECVPIAGYDDLRPAIERMAAGEPGVLCADPVLAFEETGGSSAGAKLIPYTAAGLAAFRRGLLPWLDDLFSTWPAAAAGRAYWAISPACREPRRTAGGIPVGLPSDAAYFGDCLAGVILSTLAVPPAVGAMRDVAAWRQLTLLHLAACADLALVSVWSPTFLGELLAALERDGARLASHLAAGTVPEAAAGWPAPPADPARAALLEEALASTPPCWEKLWPALALVSCWEHATARPYAARLQRELPGVALQGKGLLATEGMVSLPLSGAAQPVLALECGYFEFVDDDGRARTAGEVEADATYTLLLTTDSGLYRYAIGDRVRIAGFVQRTPMLEFVGRETSTSDLCGEKLAEPFVLRALATTGLAFAVLAPSTGSAPGYVLLLDEAEIPAQAAQALAARIDEALGANPQYAYARRIGQLRPVEPTRLSRPLAAWLAHGVKQGRRLGDIKLPALYPHADWPAAFGST